MEKSVELAYVREHYGKTLVLFGNLEIAAIEVIRETSGMKYLRAQLVRALSDYFGADNRRIEHALRVLHHADRIMDEYPGCDEDVLIAAALLHDVGIKVSEEKLGYNNGKTQEEYGPAVAEDLLKGIGFPAEKMEIVQAIIGNHHSPSRYDYPELAALKKADQIVNRDEGV